MTFEFKPAIGPPPRWLGPYSPSRGTNYGFRVRYGRLMTTRYVEYGADSWPVADSEGSHALTAYVTHRFGGGRVLILPDGKVIKPLQDDEEVGERVLIGVVRGRIRMDEPGFDMSSRGQLKAGDPWSGPTTTGIECVLEADGSLVCSWKRTADWGRTEHTERLLGPNPALAVGFRKARPGESSGRVRVTAHGIVITNRQCSDGTWSARYVGQIDVSAWPTKSGWIEANR